MKKLFIFVCVSIIFTLLSGFRTGVEHTPYPNTGFLSGDNIQLAFPQVNGGGFPLMWWRNWPDLNPGELHMTEIIRNGTGFVVDTLFWFGIIWSLFLIKGNKTLKKP